MLPQLLYLPGSLNLILKARLNPNLLNLILKVRLMLNHLSPIRPKLRKNLMPLRSLPRMIVLPRVNGHPRANTGLRVAARMESRVKTDMMVSVKMKVVATIVVIKIAFSTNALVQVVVPILTRMLLGKTIVPGATRLDTIQRISKERARVRNRVMERKNLKKLITLRTKKRVRQKEEENSSRTGVRQQNIAKCNENQRGCNKSIVFVGARGGV